ncbi:MAG: hypothetical protein QNJ67_23420 [Kiloniellales bacterium]|nr:hypothetical protein [Kiloniellales bacterium]
MNMPFRALAVSIVLCFAVMAPRAALADGGDDRSRHGTQVAGKFKFKKHGLRQHGHVRHRPSRHFGHRHFNHRHGRSFGHRHFRHRHLRRHLHGHRFRHRHNRHSYGRIYRSPRYSVYRIRLQKDLRGDPVYRGYALEPAQVESAPPVKTAGAIEKGDQGWPGTCLMTREYQTKIVIDGDVVDAYGEACLQPDGSWMRGPSVSE